MKQDNNLRQTRNAEEDAKNFETLLKFTIHWCSSFGRNSCWLVSKQLENDWRCLELIELDR